MAVALLPGKLAFVAQGIPGKTYCLLEFQLRGNGIGHAVQGAACGGCAFQRLVLCLEAGMEVSLPL